MDPGQDFRGSNLVGPRPAAPGRPGGTFSPPRGGARGGTTAPAILAAMAIKPKLLCPGPRRLADALSLLTRLYQVLRTFTGVRASS